MLKWIAVICFPLFIAGLYFIQTGQFTVEWRETAMAAVLVVGFASLVLDTFLDWLGGGYRYAPRDRVYRR